MIEKSYVEDYCIAIKEATARDYEKRGYSMNPGMVYPEYGRRFTRIVIDRGVQRHVHAFVDMTNGDVIKSAGWKAPQKGKNGLAVRFNLVDDESRERGFSAIDPYGSYLYEGVIEKRVA
jgi:hypothetical protein